MFKYKKTVKYIGVTVLLIFLAYLFLYALGRYRFEVTFYHLPSDKIEERIRVAGLSDLHNWTFGKDNEKLIGKKPKISTLPPSVSTYPALSVSTCIPTDSNTCFRLPSSFASNAFSDPP